MVQIKSSLAMYSQILRCMWQAFVKPEDRADPKRIYHMMTLSEVQKLFGSVVCALNLAIIYPPLASIILICTLCFLFCVLYSL